MLFDEGVLNKDCFQEAVVVAETRIAAGTIWEEEEVRGAEHPAFSYLIPGLVLMISLLLLSGGSGGDYGDRGDRRGGYNR